MGLGKKYFSGRDPIPVLLFLESLEGRGREGWRQNYSVNLKISREFSDPLTVNRTENASDILIIICYFLKAASLGVYSYIVH